MLKKISCNIFLQKEIVFHEGLNAIVGASCIIKNVDVEN